MMTQKILVIVPRLPPSIDGLGDYGLNLARQMRLDFGVITEFVVADPNWMGSTEIEGFHVHALKSRSATELVTFLKSFNTVLLHYVGYGYAKRGCPLWLVDGLELWYNSSPQKKLITMFHELFAFGPIWTSQFWTSPVQRWLVFRLLKITTHSLTSKNSYAEILKSYSTDKNQVIDVLPVFSNIGELENNPRLVDRKKNLVVFGGAGWRSRVYNESQKELSRVVRELKIENIIDIGSPLAFKIPPIENREIQIMGNLPSEAISKILAESVVGFFNYPPGYLAKSGIFASYCSHGVVPVGHWPKEQVADGLEEGIHYWLVDKNSQTMNLSDAQETANQAFAWYQGHRLSYQAKKFVDFLVLK